MNPTEQTKPASPPEESKSTGEILVDGVAEVVAEKKGLGISAIAYLVSVAFFILAILIFFIGGPNSIFLALALTLGLISLLVGAIAFLGGTAALKQ